jgi:mono/diheme cytochrome c family protein
MTLFLPHLPKEQHSMHVCGRKIFSEILMVFVLFILTSAFVWAGEPGDLQPRVPPERLEEAKSFQNPFTPSPDLIARGKKLYEGKNYCSACHGLEGAGVTSGERIPGAEPPTNFADAAWQAARTDGEIFWILKHGSHGTDMAPYMPLYITEEEAWEIVTYIRTFGGT